MSQGLLPPGQGKKSHADQLPPIASSFPEHVSSDIADRNTYRTPHDPDDDDSTASGPSRFILRWTRYPHRDNDIVMASFPLIQAAPQTLPTPQTQGGEEDDEEQEDEEQEEGWKDRPHRFEISYDLDATPHEMCSTVRVRWDPKSRFSMRGSKSSREGSAEDGAVMVV